VPDRLGKIFGRADVTAALNYCFGRSAEDVAEYLEENFTLAAARVEATLADGDKPVEAETSETNEQPDVDTNTAQSEPQEGDEEPEVEMGSGEENPDSSVEPSPEPTKVRTTPRPAKPSIMERFARANGFKKDGEDRIFHYDVTWIARANVKVFTLL
jgi:hypothetical protein